MFSQVPNDLDAIIVGSGIGGLTTGVLLAKVGKKVLVLEQHDQAGGCCHTFIDKGYEFDVGIHYIGDIGPGFINRTLTDHITDGQLDWAKLEEAYDVVSIGYDKDNRQYPIIENEDNWIRLMKKQFPGEDAAIDRYFEMCREVKASFDDLNGLLKLLPLWVSWIVVRFRIINLISGLWSGLFRKSTMDVVKTLTDNKDLQTVMCYCWGDYGSTPKQSHFIMQVQFKSPN